MLADFPVETAPPNAIMNFFAWAANSQWRMGIYTQNLHGVLTFSSES
jgi:hypothetical protein